MGNASNRLNELEALKRQRKEGYIDLLTYYKGLLNVLAELVQNLKEEGISEAEAKKQIPLVLVFVEEQIEKLAGREG